MRFQKTVIVFVAIGLAFISARSPLQKDELKVDYSWEDDFSKPEKEKIESWLNDVSQSVAQTFGAYPFTVKFYLHRQNSGEPVPWAETSRTGEQAVHFHVDPRFSLKEFQMDWTAPHEITHLSIPFVGRSNMWFSEGYASYWQWQILLQQGIYSTKEIEKKYRDKMEIIMPYYDTEESFLETSKTLTSARNYRALYWGGACYFFQADVLLKKNHDTNLMDVIRAYQSKGRLTDENLDELIKSLDKISKSNVFSKLLYTFQNGSAKEAVMPTELSF